MKGGKGRQEKKKKKEEAAATEYWERKETKDCEERGTECERWNLALHGLQDVEASGLPKNRAFTKPLENKGFRDMT